VGLALRIRDLNEDTFATMKVTTKRCSGCDPDVPGHAERKACPVCHGSGQEGLSFQGTFSEITTSKMEGVKGPRKFASDCDYDGDGDDEVQDLEY
jgi:hypothetical protein